jgi:hypothetical protein
MKQSQTLEGLGNNLLSYFKKYNCRPGDALPVNKINMWWHNDGKLKETLIEGLEWLFEKEYIEEKKGHKNAIFLTEKGFKAINI